MRVRSAAPGSSPGAGGSGLLGAQFDGDAQDRAQHGEHVGRAGDEGCALFDQVIRTLGARVKGRAGHGEDFAALFQREAGGDQRARALGRLHDHNAGAEP